LDLKEFLRIYQEDHRSFEIIDALDSGELSRIHIQGIIGSSKPVVGAAIFKRSPYNHFFVLPDKESAAYFYNDLENLFEEQSVNYKAVPVSHPASRPITSTTMTLEWDSAVVFSLAVYSVTALAADGNPGQRTASISFPS